MYTRFPPRLARFTFLLGLAALAVCALVVFPLQWLTLKAEVTASQITGAYATRAGEPTPQPEFSPAPHDDRQLAQKAGRRTVRTLTPVLVFIGFALVCFLIEIATGPRSGA